MRAGSPPQAEALLRAPKWPGCSPIPCGTSRGVARRMAATGVPAAARLAAHVLLVYETPLLQALADRLLPGRTEGAEVWCIFDNTASGAATANALELLRLLEERR